MSVANGEIGYCEVGILFDFLSINSISVRYDISCLFWPGDTALLTMFMFDRITTVMKTVGLIPRITIIEKSILPHEKTRTFDPSVMKSYLIPLI